MYEPSARRQQHVAWRDFRRLAGPTERHLRAERRDLAGENDAGIRGVQIGPGATAFTRMPRAASACDRERVNATMAPFVAA